MGSQRSSGSGAVRRLGTGKSEVSLSAAGAATINIVNQENTRAFINDTGTITAGQELALEAKADSSTWALAGSLAVNTSTADSSTGLAGAIGVNIMNHDDRAFIDGAQVAAGSVDRLGRTIRRDPVPDRRRLRRDQRARAPPSPARSP